MAWSATRGARSGGGVAQRIHVADHRREVGAGGQRHVAAAVRGQRLGRERERRARAARRHRAAADQRHWAGGAVEGSGSLPVADHHGGDAVLRRAVDQLVGIGEIDQRVAGLVEEAHHLDVLEDDAGPAE